MNKKIIALAVASAFAAPMAAQAEIKVYGQGQVEYASYGGTNADGVDVVDNARGRIGFKSTEDLGNGLKALAKFEFKVDTADGDASGGNTALGKREMMIGLKGGFGEFQAGRLKTAYKYTGGVKYDPFVATVLEARNNYGMTGKLGVGSIKNAAGHNGFVDHSIAYKNKFGNLHFWLTYDLDDGGNQGVMDLATNTGTTAATIPAVGGNAFTAALKYKQKNWELFVAAVDDDNNGGTGPSYSSTKVGGQWKGGAHKISVQVEMADFYGADLDVYYVDYQLKFGKNIFDVAIGNTDYVGFTDADFLRVALKHKFSKKTSAWVGYRTSELNGTGFDADVLALGMRVDF